ncbi:MAG: FAD-dependent oxidoreductase [Candidatus Cryptobacteroides sp.]
MNRINCFGALLAATCLVFASCDGDMSFNPSVEQQGTVLVVGGGASGCAAAIQAARLGVPTTLVEESPWLGGMLTSAGVTATDGCYYLRGGLFAEFTDKLASYYGSYDALKTGWVSNILFEPHVGEEVFEQLCGAERMLRVVKECRFESAVKTGKGWKVYFEDKDGHRLSYDCDILIDATELGDVAKAVGVEYRIGMDSSEETGEKAAIGPNEVVQDLTMVMTLKNYGKDMSIAKPEAYDRSKYVNCCQNSLNVPSNTGQTLWSPAMMMSYGKCPGGKYMINWPISGNDYYVNMVDMSREEREEAIRQAKLHSLGFLYFLQTELGYNTYYLADDEYPSEDLFPFYPYHRESRRICGEYLFTVDEAASTFSTDAYRTGIAVGDYPVDHHHFAHPQWENYKINFPKIIPFSLPLGCLVPLEVENLIVAEKSISVSNLINGSTRLQPVVMELGQAAGVLAFQALKDKLPIREVNIRSVQKELLKAGALMMPYRDCLSSDPDFESIHKIGLTGIMRGIGQTVGWSNECHFYPEENLKWSDLYLDDYFGIDYNSSANTVSRDEFRALLEGILESAELKGAGVAGDVVEDGVGTGDRAEAAGDLADRDYVGDNSRVVYGSGTAMNGAGLSSVSGADPISRREAARLLNQYLDPFSREITWSGKLK